MAPCLRQQDDCIGTGEMAASFKQMRGACMIGCLLHDIISPVEPRGDSCPGATHRAAQSLACPSSSPRVPRNVPFCSPSTSATHKHTTHTITPPKTDAPGMYSKPENSRVPSTLNWDTAAGSINSLEQRRFGRRVVGMPGLMEPGKRRCLVARVVPPCSPLPIRPFLRNACARPAACPSSAKHERRPVHPDSRLT